MYGGEEEKQLADRRAEKQLADRPALVRQVSAFMKLNKLSQKKVGQELEPTFSTKVISQWLNHKYQGRNDLVRNALTSTFAQRAARAQACSKSKTAAFSLYLPQVDEAMKVWLAKGRQGSQGTLSFTAKGTES